MARTRGKSHHRLTRDAERLIALAQGLGASGSRIEDRFWEAATAALATKLIENGNDMPLESALDHLWTRNLPAYDGLVEAVEAASESLVIERDGARWEVLLVAAPVIAWSRYAIPSGAIGREDAQALAVQLQAHVLADGTRVALSPWLYSIDQLPQAYSELLKLAQRLGAIAVDGQTPKVDAAKLPETAQMLADTRFVVAAVAAPEGAAHFRWQQDSTGHAGRTHSAEQWIAQARPTLAKLLPGCVFECLLPDAYYVNCRESDRCVRPYAVRAAVAFLESALKVPAAKLRAVVAGFGEERVDEYRIGFTRPGENDVAHGVVWPLFGREDENSRPGPVDELLAQLKECGVTDVVELKGLFTPEYCEECGAPLFPSPDSGIVHAELPEEADTQAAHFH
jgi:hypothetical protein